MLPVLGVSLLFSIALCVHVVRTGQAMYWLWIILAIPWLGGIVYLVAVVLPSLAGGPTARRLSQGARETLDPEREYRRAKAACDDTPTVHNRMRLAKAAAPWGGTRRRRASTARPPRASTPTTRPCSWAAPWP
ncbi:MAG: hypothetical protein ABI906_00180 [Pseudomonadota bacterium]